MSKPTKQPPQWRADNPHPKLGDIWQWDGQIFVLLIDAHYRLLSVTETQRMVKMLYLDSLEVESYPMAYFSDYRWRCISTTEEDVDVVDEHIST